MINVNWKFCTRLHTIGLARRTIIYFLNRRKTRVAEISSGDNAIVNYISKLSRNYLIREVSFQRFQQLLKKSCNLTELLELDFPFNFNVCKYFHMYRELTERH